MFLTKITVNPYSRHASRILRHYYAHTIMAAIFPDETTNPRLLYRVEDNPFSNEITILAQSQYHPAAEWFVQNQGFALSVNTKPYNPILEVGDRFRFRLVASPVRRSADGNHLAYKRTNEEGDDWLRERQRGFRVLTVTQTLQSLEKISPTDSSSYAIPVVQYDGTLEVVDPAEMTKVLQNGIGRSRHLGLGMLSLAKC